MTLPVAVWLAYVICLGALVPYVVRRGEGHIVTAAVVVFYMWLAGEAAVLRGWHVPVGLYLAMDVAAGLWFGTRRQRWPFAFALTYAAQVATSLLKLAGWPSDDMAWWWIHNVTTFTQLAALLAWCRAAGCGRG